MFILNFENAKVPQRLLRIMIPEAEDGKLMVLHACMDYLWKLRDGTADGKLRDGAVITDVARLSEACDYGWNAILEIIRDFDFEKSDQVEREDEPDETSEEVDPDVCQIYLQPDLLEHVQKMARMKHVSKEDYIRRLIRKDMKEARKRQEEVQDGD